MNAGLCPEHQIRPEAVSEENWFFRLSAYTNHILAILESGQVRIEPPAKRNEVLAFVRAGLADFSVSRPAARAGGWGIGVPDDPCQVIYVWWDALTNYITALNYAEHDQLYQDWWIESAQRIHVIGKGITRFHAVYWLALLLSAGLRLPTAIFVHDYLTVNGAKISKSTGSAVSPVDLVNRFGVDALRWWLLREVAPVGDADFTVDRLVDTANRDLAHGIGNLVNRAVTLVHKFRGGALQPQPRPILATQALAVACRKLPGRIDDHLDRFDLRAGAQALCALVDEANRLIETTRPWELARAEKTGNRPAADHLDAVLANLIHASRTLTAEFSPYIPTAAAKLRDQLSEGDQVGIPQPVFPRLQNSNPV